jgi:hypothetical protein
LNNLVIENVKGSVANVKGDLLLGQSFLSRFKSWSIDNARSWQPSRKGPNPATARDVPSLWAAVGWRADFDCSPLRERVAAIAGPPFKTFVLAVALAIPPEQNAVSRF